MIACENRAVSISAAAGLLALAVACGAPRAQESRSDPTLARTRADVARLVSFGTRHTSSETASETRGIGAARRWLAEEFARISQEHHGGALKVESFSFQLPASERLPAGGEVVNVAGILTGSDPKRLVAVSGHYDSRASDPLDARSDAPGANDDASGVAAVLEAARLCAGLTPRATVVFLAVAGEEQGLLGSRAQAEAWKAAGFEVEAFVTNDIVGGATATDGRRDARRIRLFSEGVPSAGPKVAGSDNDAPSRQLARAIRGIAAGVDAGSRLDVELILRQDRYLRGGDHKPFNDIGVAAVRLTEGIENYTQQHQDVRVENGVQFGDLERFVDFEYVARVAHLNAAIVRALGAAPRPPATVNMDTTELSSDTRLFWSSSPDAVRYEVVMRPTHAADWTSVRDAGNVTEMLLPAISKDDWLFGVRAIGASGDASIPVYPRPWKRP